MTSTMGYDPYHHPTSSSTTSSSSSYRRWYAEVTTPAPQLMATKRGRTPLSVYSSHASPLSSSTRLRYSSSPGGRVFQPSSTTVERELSQAAQIGSEFRAVRTRERVQLQDLNDRFAGFVERVHELEQQNRILETDLERLRRRHAQPARLGALYEQEARALRAAVDRAQAERQEALGRREHLEQTLGALQARHQEEALAREETEARLRELREGADRAALARAEAEKRVEALLDELAFLRKIHEGEVADLQARVQHSARVALESEASATTVLDLSGALRDIRAQYEGLAAKNMRSAEDWFQGKVGWLSESVAQHSHAVRSSKGEAGEIRSQLQAHLLEIDACRGINHSLEKQLCDAEENHAAEIAAMQGVIQEQERELGATKQEMARYLKEYQDLLNVKMALDIEIAAYRKLLEGEESRFNVGLVGGASSMYSSHALSVAPPSYSRPMYSSLSSGAPYLTTSRVHLGSTFTTSREVVCASRSQKAEAIPQPEEEPEEEKEEEEEEKEEEEEEEEKVEGGEEEEVKEEEGGEEDGGEEKGEEEQEKEEGGEEGKGDKEDKETTKDNEGGGEGAEEKTEDTEGGGEGAEEKTEDTEGGGEGAEEKTEDTEGGGEGAEEKTEDTEATEQVVEKEVSDDGGEGGAKENGKEEDEKKEEEKADEKKTDQEEEVKPDMKAETEGGKTVQPEKKSEKPQGKEMKDEAVTEKTKEEK
ncbi:unnamed protein product [Lota lota]